MLSFSFLAVSAALVAARGAGAFTVPISRRASPFSVNTGGVKSIASMVGSGDIMDVSDLLYSAQIQVGSGTFTVQLDTGSSDLWVFANADPSQFGAADYNLNILQNLNITYGLGSVAGTAASATVQFNDYTVQNQVFLDVKVPDMDNLFAQNVFGILGLSFASASVLANAFLGTTMPPLGLPFLQNVFASQTGQPNQIAFFLDRAGDIGGDPTGTFTIGTVDSQFAAVEQTPDLPVFVNPDPNDLQRWTVSVDALVIAGQSYAVPSTVNGAPGGKQLALLDTGTSVAFIPAGAVQALYMSIQGAVYDSQIDMWFVPCTASTTFAFVIGGQMINIHPLDITEVTLAQLGDGSNATVCVNAFQTSDGLGDGEFDLLLGDSFLRNAFSVYNFGPMDALGNPTSPPTAKLLAVTDPSTAQADFQASRQKALAMLPPPADLTNAAVMADVKNFATSAAAARGRGRKGNGRHRNKNHPPTALVVNAGADPSSTSVAGSVQRLLDLSPLIVALLAANVALALALCFLGVCIFRQNRRKRTARAADQIPLKAYQPVRDDDDSAPRKRDSGVFVPPRTSGFAPPVTPSPFADDASQKRLSAAFVPLPRSAAPSPSPVVEPSISRGGETQPSNQYQQHMGYAHGG